MKKPDFELAHNANGGREFSIEMCRCDLSVGFYPCEYCAVRQVLLDSEKEIERVRDIIEDEWICECYDEYGNRKSRNCGRCQVLKD